jgi:hypothetical protein
MVDHAMSARHIDTFGDALEEAEPRPLDDSLREEKKNYAERLSASSAMLIAGQLRSYFPGILPGVDGARSEALPRAGKRVKRLDINYSSIHLGLGLGISVKTLNFRDPKTKRYTKNPTRLDNELRAEAMDHHQRQPFAVLAAVVLMPIDACDDGDRKRPKTSWSSFAQVVNVLRFRVGRRSIKDESQLFELGFVGLYEHASPRRGDVGFFDLSQQPPQFGRPDLMDSSRLVARIVAAYDDRNSVKRAWEKDRSDAVPYEDLVAGETSDEEDDDLY